MDLAAFRSAYSLTPLRPHLALVSSAIWSGMDRHGVSGCSTVAESNPENFPVELTVADAAALVLVLDACVSEFDHDGERAATFGRYADLERAAAWLRAYISEFVASEL